MSEAPETSFEAALAAFHSGAIDQARTIAEDAVTRHPAPRWHHLLGLIRCRLGDFDGGVEQSLLAVAGAPGNIGFKVMLARALIDSGRPGEVLAMANPPPGESPEAIALWHARAEAADRVGDPIEQAASWRALAELRPGDLGNWVNLGRALIRAQDHDAAETAYRRALALNPANLDLVNELGDLLERTNRIAALGALIDDAASIMISGDRLPFLSASLERRRGNPAVAEAILSGAADRDPMRWNRLKAKVAEELGKPAEAFAAAQAMNRAQPDLAQWRARAARYRSGLRDLASTISTEWAERLPVLAPLAGPPPVFMLGFPRSGTTLLDTFLMGHPRLVVLEEYPLLQTAGKPTGPLAGLAGIDHEALVSARDTYLAERGRLLEPGSNGIEIDKFPLNLNAAPLIHCLFPQAKIIFVQRHPCDAVLSGYMQAFDANIGMASFLDLADAADFFDACLSLWSASRTALPLNVHAVAYEELVEDPEAVLRLLLDFLGVAWDERLLDHRSTAAARGFIPNTSYDQVTEPLSKDPVFRWRRYGDQMAPVLPVLLPWARQLGYRDD
ncbi:MAG: sulfotransferase [Sphingomonas sp.]|nr:sulfotransferase [Sphingomonas sp.]